MNTVLSAPADEQTRSSPPSWLRHDAFSRHVSPADRLALHVGLALVTWSRRPRRTPAVPTRATLQARRLLAEQRVDRERSAERTLRLTVPTR